MNKMASNDKHYIVNEQYYNQIKMWQKCTIKISLPHELPTKWYYKPLIKRNTKIHIITVLTNRMSHTVSHYPSNLHMDKEN